MYGSNNLKEFITVTNDYVECPIKDCNHTVKRQRNKFRTEDEFLCPVHSIYISPSTFEYVNEQDNLLWNNPDDIELLCSIKSVKRECRMARDNSEDAATWNIFRFLESSNLIFKYLTELTNYTYNTAEIIYWSYCQKEKSSWTWLNKARREFGEDLNRSSEPDLIVLTDKALFFIEAKLGASNCTQPSDPNNSKKYLTGGNSSFSKVFSADYSTIAIERQKYELMRFWLLGTWIAAQMELDFYLINLVLEGRETDIGSEFGSLIIGNMNQKFKRATWEHIYTIMDSEAAPDTKLFIDYYKNKTLGYDGKRQLKRAFNIY